ncbi:MAG: MvdC/MvdD family ATP grasp protein [Candidatus Dormibacteria bacterium]
MTVAEPVVLVVGDAGDWSATEVGKHLDARGVRWVLLDTADFPQRMSLDARLDADHGGWQGELAIDGQTLRLAEVTAVYYRKPGDFDLPDGLSGPERRFSHAQARVGLGGVLASLPVRWLSHPSALADAEYKPRQLALLRQAGLTTPPTLVTNDAAAVRVFAAAHGDLVVKPLAEPIVWEGGGESVVFTRRVRAVDLDTLTGVDTTAHLFQAFQDKRCECRVMAVGVDRLFAVAIHAGSSESYVDWRSDYASLRYEVIETPGHIRAGIARYLCAASLAYSAFDFVITPDGRWVTLEANGSGMWGWLAEECGLPIAEAIADELTGR